MELTLDNGQSSDIEHPYRTSSAITAMQRDLTSAVYNGGGSI